MASWQSILFKWAFRRRMRRRQAVEDRFDIARARANLEAMSAQIPPAADMKYEAFTLNGLPAEWVTPPVISGNKVVLYLHGGGYTIGSINTHRNLAGSIARSAEARALLVEYRLAPENKFPAAVEDAVEAYHWLLSNQFDPGQIFLAGDSAGGGLILATMLSLRDAGEPLPAAAVCLSPWTDLAGTGESMVTNAKADPWLNAEGLIPAGQLYLGGADPRTPLASPLYADLSGLPPLLIQVGTAEILLSDATRLAEKAEAAGVDVTLEVWDGMMHVFQAFSSRIPEGKKAVHSIGSFIKKHAGLPFSQARAR